jgi:hypothetical protein
MLHLPPGEQRKVVKMDYLSSAISKYEQSQGDVTTGYSEQLKREAEFYIKVAIAEKLDTMIKKLGAIADDVALHSRYIARGG